jgi:hypothetical protein
MADPERMEAVRVRRRGPVLGAGRGSRASDIDLDATLVTAHSDNEQAAGNYKHGFGFHPLLRYEATTDEALAGILRPGNASANTAVDHVTVLDLSFAQLPRACAARPYSSLRTPAGRPTPSSTTQARSVCASRSALACVRFTVPRRI